MKKITITLFAFALLFSLTECNNSRPEKVCTDAGTRGKLISELMNNDVYMKEVMDSMRTKHPDVILNTIFIIAKDDKQMQESMMDKMTEGCKMDSSMCKMMMGKTMDMCDMDKSKCDMMMGSMQSRPNVMKSMEGMCGMKGMKMEKKKEEHRK